MASPCVRDLGDRIPCGGERGKEKKHERNKGYIQCYGGYASGVLPRAVVRHSVLDGLPLVGKEKKHDCARTNYDSCRGNSKP